ncbi:MAG: hypothetical protein AB1500_01620 [Bacillota bacterium]
MFAESEVLEIINRKIRSDEGPGHQTGGSGHAGFVEYKIDGFQTRQISRELLEIAYRYRVSVETEFTYYPDNPPAEYFYQKVIVVNREKEIVSETPKMNTGDKNNDEWEQAKLQIEMYLKKLLLKIEWRYGDCRSPFVYPPAFEAVRLEDGTREYRCIVKSDFNGNECLVFQSAKPSDLPGMIIDDFSRRFSFIE